MQTPEKYRLIAEKIAILAEKAATPEEKLRLLSIAACWARLAEVALASNEASLPVMAVNALEKAGSTASVIYVIDGDDPSDNVTSDNMKNWVPKGSSTWKRSSRAREN